MLDTFGVSLDVGEHTAHPAFSDVRLAGFFGGELNNFLCLALGADKQHLLATANNLSHERQRLFQTFYRLGKVDNVAAVALTVDVLGHFWVPAAGFVAKMRASGEQ